MDYINLDILKCSALMIISGLLLLEGFSGRFRFAKNGE